MNSAESARMVSYSRGESSICSMQLCSPHSQTILRLPSTRNVSLSSFTCSLTLRKSASFSPTRLARSSTRRLPWIEFLCDLGGATDLLDHDVARLASHHLEVLLGGSLVARQVEKAGGVGADLLVFPRGQQDDLPAGRICAFADERQRACHRVLLR